MARDKGIEEAIQSFAILDKQGRYRFWVVGKGGEPYLDYLKGLVKKLRLHDRVKFWGFVDEKKKFELLARAWVLVNPSRHEGWGLVNIEANAVGTPVVAYRVAGLVDSVKEGVSGKFCGRNRPKEMADAVRSILGDRKEYTRLCRGAVSWSRQFDWEKARRMSLEILGELAGRGGE